MGKSNQKGLGVDSRQEMVRLLSLHRSRSENRPAKDGLHFSPAGPEVRNDEDASETETGKGDCST